VTDSEYETFRQACIKACPDAAQAASLAANCLLYENDPGPDKLQANLPGSLRIPRSESWQLSYAMNLLKHCEGDTRRLAAARSACTSMCVRSTFRNGGWGRVELSRAINLCDQALRMIEGARASDGERGTQILRAMCNYEGGMTFLGGLIAEVAEDTESDFASAVGAAGGTMRDVPRPEEVVAWAFPWL
jgi:hypothetical protein